MSGCSGRRSRTTSSYRREFDDASREATRALLHGQQDYGVIHNVACIYAEMAARDTGQARRHEDMAIDMLQKAVAIWRKRGAGPNEIELIRTETAIRPALRNRPEFQRV